MELQFKTRTVTCLEQVLREDQSSEQTQEIRLSDGMPDVGRIIGSWGQCILRGKEWHSGYVSFSGGMMVWVLYAPEGDGEIQMVSSWIPFQMRWPLPEGIPDGTLRIISLPALVDARSVSPRKIMVRAGMHVAAEAMVRKQVDVPVPGEDLPQVQVLRSRYPVRLWQESGEKTFLMDEELSLPESAPKIKRLVCYQLEPKITDSRAVGDKLVFQGSGKLRVLYESDAGQIHSWDFSLPISQYAQLDQLYDGDIQADVRPAVTSLETELTDAGLLRLKAGLVAQYLISQRQVLELAEEAYSLQWELEESREELSLPVILETRREMVSAEQRLNTEANLVVDSWLYPDFPKQVRTGMDGTLRYPGVFQTLYYGTNGDLNTGTARWEMEVPMKTGDQSSLSAMTEPAQVQAMAGTGELILKAELPVDLTVTAQQSFSPLSSIKTGEKKQPDSARPSLILRKAGQDRLWDIARTSGSTVEAIQKANGLSEEPAPDRMLLIPVL